MNYSNISSPHDLYNYLTINDNGNIDNISLAKDWFDLNCYPNQIYYTKDNHMFIVYKDSESNFNLFEMNFEDKHGIRKFDTVDNAILYYKCLEALNAEKEGWISDFKVFECERIEKNKVYQKQKALHNM